MKILSVHNFYQRPGGEDQIFASEGALLEGKGHRVVRYEDHNRRIDGGLLTGLTTVWNAASYRRLRAVVSGERPDVAHFHNTFPLISPAGYYALGGCGIPVIQTLQNFRLLCPSATFMREGRVCEDCARGRSFLPAIAHGCYRQSRAATTAVVTMLTAHRAVGTWNRIVDFYIAPTEFMRRKFIEHGFPAHKIVVKPNPVLPDPECGEGTGKFALFVGRLAEEKGIRTLAAAWRTLSDIPLLVAGEGPLAETEWPAGVTALGAQPHSEVLRLMQSARVLIFPSLWYEGQPMTIVESLACGLPVIGSNLGSVGEMIEHDRTGRLFRPGDAVDLAAQVRWVFSHPDEVQRMRVAARKEFEANYTAERNYRLLIDIYERAIENKQLRGRKIS